MLKGRKKKTRTGDPPIRATEKCGGSEGKRSILAISLAQLQRKGGGEDTRVWLKSLG